MRIFYGIMVLWSILSMFNALRGHGIFAPMFFIAFLLLGIWAFRKFREAGRRQRERRKAWRNNPNNWSV